MGFWKKDTPEELERKALQARQEADQLESITKLQQGYLPVAASRRLQKQADMGGSFFSSTLSIPEYLLARQVGLQPLSQVMGTTFMRVEPEEGDGIMSEVSGELIYLATAKSSAQALAVERLRMEGKALGAHGIIGVKLQTSEFSWSRGFAQFTAVGTAVRLPDSQMLREAKNLPFTSTLSGQEFWQLYESGYWPCGLVIGNGIYLAANCWGIPFGMTPTLNATYVQAAAMQMNCELKGFSDGISLAREAAMKNLSHEIKSVGGDGAIDMDIDLNIEHRKHGELAVIVDCSAVGTAVTYRSDGHNKLLDKRLFIMDLARKTDESIKAPTDHD